MTKSEIDFSAWEAPPPPEGLADAVVARMAEPEPLPEPAPPRRRWVIAASAAAVLAIAGGLWAITRPHGAAVPDHGEVVADKAQHLELGGVSVDLDRGADIRWQRTRTALEVEQRAGAASWRVAKEQHIRIGATVAAIDATGASLRVEVPMNPSDARVIGASAATAAAVAMVTVVVYEGHVKVSSSGQTVIVQPGTTYAVPAPAPAPVVGAATIDAKPKLAVFELESGDGVGEQLTGLLRERVAGLSSVRFVATDKHFGDLAILHDCASEAPLCLGAIGRDVGVDSFVYGHITSRRDGYEVDAKRFADGRIIAESYQVIPPSEALAPLADSIVATLFDVRPDTPDDAAVQRILAAAAPQLRACLKGAVTDETITVEINSDGKPTSVRSQGSGGGEDSTCIVRVAQTLSFPKSKHGGTFTSHVSTACDADALIADGNSRMSAGRHLEALAKYEAALACKPEERTERLAFMAACNARNVTKAHEHWGKLGASSQTQVLQICVRNGITKDQLDPCNVDDLIAKGMTAEQGGNHAAALGGFEAAIACQPSTRVYELAFMAACNAKSVAKARQYWAKIPVATGQQLKQMCIRNGISEDTLDGGPAAPPPADGMGRVRIDSVPPAMILLDGTDLGRRTPDIVTTQPGKHKVTYVIGHDRYTFPVTVNAGETETLSKTLQ
ncbi:MAG TPA: PEGA domain-containing protein [Kofleriaceae bacterium]|nr:PEGA domain-containing protein [Kofleriaceae bacterium]